jgi:hypothetical protein
MFQISNPPVNKKFPSWLGLDYSEPKKDEELATSRSNINLLVWLKKLAWD